MSDFWTYLKNLFTEVPDPPVVMVMVPPKAVIPPPEAWKAPVHVPPAVVNTFDTNAVNQTPKPMPEWLTSEPVAPVVMVPVRKPRVKKAKAASRKSADRPWVKPRTRK